jgi:hypothetical protein
MPKFGTRAHLLPWLAYYPHQVLLRADLYTGSAYQTLQGFCIGLSLGPRGHSERASVVKFSIGGAAGIAIC